jgi:hypothetical protein
MQDFTKPHVDVENLPKVQNKWLTNDRLWNFVFWFCMSFGLAAGNVFKFQWVMHDLASATDWTSLIIFPLLIIIFNRTRFIKKDTFANSDGTTISKTQMPYAFPLATLSGFGIAFVVAETILPKGYGNFFVAFAFFVFLFSGISLYFIFKNCPISILFNRKFWTIEGELKGKSKSTDTSSFRSTVISNPTYGCRPANHR